MKAGGILFVNGDNDMLSNVHAKSRLPYRPLWTWSNNDYRAEDLSYPDGFPSFTMVHGEVRVPVKLTVMGEHNVMNALAALAVADAYGVPLADAAEKLLEFGGFKNRQQIYHKKWLYDRGRYLQCKPGFDESGDRCTFFLPAGRRIAVLADMKELGERIRFSSTVKLVWFWGGTGGDLGCVYGELARAGRGSKRPNRTCSCCFFSWREEKDVMVAGFQAGVGVRVGFRVSSL